MLHHPQINIFLEIADKNADIPTQGRKRLENEAYIENALQHICFMVKDAQKAFDLAIEAGALPLTNTLNIIDLQGLNFDNKPRVKNTLVYSPNGEVIEFLEQIEF